MQSTEQSVGIISRGFSAPTSFYIKIGGIGMLIPPKILLDNNENVNENGCI